VTTSPDFITGSAGDVPRPRLAAAPTDPALPIDTVIGTDLEAVLGQQLAADLDALLAAELEDDYKLDLPASGPLPYGQPATERWLGGLAWKTTAFAVIAACTATLGGLSVLLRATGSRHTSLGVTVLELIWVFPFAVAVLNLAGMALQRRPSEQSSSSLSQTVVFRYVSRGQNRQALVDSVHTVHQVMERYPLFPYRIEAVVDNNAVHLDPHPLLSEIVVPANYQTGRGTLFKARALHYAVGHTQHADDTWIFHCDEESHVTPSVVRGIAQAVEAEERTGEHRIGQGLIVYVRTLRDKPLLTLADSIRVADDLGRWNLQNRIFGAPLFGMHGSFVLVRNSIEQTIGFDLGPQGSVTEDTWWALLVYAAGWRTRWVDGVVVEQSPERIVDFVKQRQRWFDGLVRVARHCDTPLRYRASLAAFVAVWALAPLSVIATVLLLTAGVRLPALETALATATFGLYAGSYLIGLLTSLRVGRVSWVRRALLIACQFVLMPLFATFEAAGVTSALLAARRGIRFHVISKQH